MDQEERRAAKRRLITALRQGQLWQAASAGYPTSRATAYRLRQRADAEGEAALVDGRHGHPKKVRAPVAANQRAAVSAACLEGVMQA
jgi:transposase